MKGSVGMGAEGEGKSLQARVEGMNNMGGGGRCTGGGKRGRYRSEKGNGLHGHLKGSRKRLGDWSGKKDKGDR